MLAVTSALLALALGPPSGSPDAVTIYPTPAGVAADPDYVVEVQGRPVFVFATPVAAVASFDMRAPVEVVIRPRRDARWVDVRPLSAGVVPRIEGGVIRLTLHGPARLSVELNKEPLRHPLFLFANPPALPVPPGPGVRLFAAGQVHRPGLIDLADGETVYIEGGAVVEGAIRAQGRKNVRILGRGVLDGSHNRELAVTAGHRVRMIELRDCADAQVEGITLVNSPTWQIVPINCDRLRIENVKIVSDNGSDDGIDVVRSRDVDIDQVFIHTKDDCVVIKAHLDYPSDVTTTRVRVRRSVFWNAAWGNALEIGFELRAAEVSHIRFEDSDIIHVQDGAAFSIHNADGATVRDVLWRNIRVEDATQKLIDLAIFQSQYSVDAPKDPAQIKARYLSGAWDGVLDTRAPDAHAAAAPFRGRIEDIRFENIAVLDGRLPFSIVSGFDRAHSVRGVVIRNLTLRGRRLRNPREAQLVVSDGDVRFAP